MMIQPKYLKFNELLNGRLFRIPAYQRAYSWGRKQRQDLFFDINRLRTADDDAVHFMATMVGLNRRKKIIATNEFHEIEVVDGQQRLTTLIILYKSLLMSLNRSDKEERSFANEIEALLVKGDDLSLLLLQTNHDTSNYFADFLRKGTYPPAGEAKALADRFLLEAMEDCSDFVTEWEGSKLELGTILKNRLALIFHEIEDEAAVYTVFEVLNSRGLVVASLDRLKTALMGMAFENSEDNKEETIHELHQTWAEIYRWVGLHQGRSSEALRFAATLKSDLSLNKVQGEEGAVETLLDLAGNSARGTVEVSRWVLEVVKAVDALMIDGRRAAVTKISQSRLLAVAIELSSTSNSKERDELLDAWEKVTFRIFGMHRRDARTGVGRYVRLARRLLIENMEHEDALTAIRALATGDFAINSSVEQLRREDSYDGWEVELRYFMFRYEEHLARERGHNFSNAQWERIWEATPAQSIEHITPQSSGRRYVHRLGNLTLLPPKLNSKLQDMSPSKKAEEYEKTGLLIAAELKPDLQRWKLDSVKKREDALLKWARREWAD